MPAPERPRRASSPSSRLANAGTEGPVGRPRNGHGAISTRGSLRIRLTFQPVPGLRMNARSPTTAMLTGVPIGVASRR